MSDHTIYKPDERSGCWGGCYLDDLHAFRELCAGSNTLLKVCEGTILAVAADAAGFFVALHPGAAVQAVIVALLLAHAFNLRGFLLFPKLGCISNKHVCTLINTGFPHTAGMGDKL